VVTHLLRSVVPTPFYSRAQYTATARIGYDFPSRQPSEVASK
jgi:hypothetical protein